MHDSARRGVAVGFFDGVHRGHQRILSAARVALTFRNHPLSLLAPARAPRLIMPFAARERAIRACGVEAVVALDFTPDLAALEPEDFARRYLGAIEGNRPYHPNLIHCGANWRFGRGGRGDPSLLRALGFEVRVAEDATRRGERISSTRIRAALERGEVEEANAMLGRPWCMTGRVVAGKGLGRRLGFPTLNVVPEGLELRLPRGVYAVEADGARAVANYGVAPTMGDRAWPTPLLEVHLLTPPSSSNQTIKQSNNPTISVAFLSFLRPERTFPSQAALQAQIAQDCAAARQWEASSRNERGED